MSQTPPPPTLLDAGTVDTRVHAGIATVTFGHPKGNSLPGALLSRIAEAIALAGQDAAARVIVLRSQGSGPFCAGASFDELRAVRDKAAGKHFFSGFAKVILAMIRSPKLVVTRVQGRTAGGSVGLIAASDYALAAAWGVTMETRRVVGGPGALTPHAGPEAR